MQHVHIADFYNRKKLFRRTTGLLYLNNGELTFVTLSGVESLGPVKGARVSQTKHGLTINGQYWERDGGRVPISQQTVRDMFALAPKVPKGAVEKSIKVLAKDVSEYQSWMYQDGKHTPETFAALLRYEGAIQA